MNNTNVVRILPVELTEPEILVIGKKSAQTVQEKESLEFQFDRIRKDWKGKIALRDEKIHDYAVLVNQGFEDREVDCKWDYRWKENKKDLIRLDTGEIIKTEPISPEERQKKMKFLDGKKKKETEKGKKKNNILDIGDKKP